MRGLIRSNKLDEAKEELDRLSVITYLPSDKELNTLYNLLKARVLLKQNDTEQARAILSDIDLSAIEFDNELMHIYYSSNGTLHHRDGNLKEGLDFYIKAREYMKGGFEENQGLFYNISHSLYALGYTFNTIAFIEENCNLKLNEQTTRLIFAIEFVLAKSYIKTNNIEKAKKWLASCFEKAEIIGDDELIGSVLLNYAYLYRRCQDCERALEYIDKAFCHLQKESVRYIEALYQKARCYIEIGDFSVSENLIAEGKELSQNNKAYSISFECLNHLMTMDQKESWKYLDAVAIPYFLEINEKDAALDYCIILQELYAKKNFMKKQLRIEKIINSLYKDMMEGNVVL